MISGFYDGSAALTVQDGKKALICFDWDRGVNGKKCEYFDGEHSSILKNKNIDMESKYRHWYGKLGYYKGKPTSVGSNGGSGMNEVETLDSTGWSTLTDFPKELVKKKILI